MNDTEVVHLPERSRYELRVDGRPAGYMSYRTGDGRVLVEHTKIRTTYEGRGLASVLARGALDDIRAKGLRLVVECSYLADWLTRNSEYADLVDQDGAPDAAAS